MVTTSRIRALIDQYHLNDLVADLGLTVPTRTSPGGVTHLRGCDGNPAPTVDMALVDYLTAPACRRCQATLPRLLTGRHGKVLAAYLTAYDRIARVAAGTRPGHADVGRLATLGTTMSRLLADVDRCQSGTPDLSRHRRALSEAVSQTRAQIRAAINDQDVQRILAAVRDELVPAAYREHATFDTTLTVIGVTPEPALTGALRAVREVMSAGGPAGTLLVFGPAYLVDAMNRQLPAGADVYLTHAPLPRDYDLLTVVASLWDPRGGPMSNLATVVEAATTITR